MTEIVREGLVRSVPFTVRSDENSAEGDGLTLTGHAAVFNQDTEINSWEGVFTETIAPGAFKKTIRERTPVLQFDHGRHPLVGSIPIGKIESLSEDTEGLYVEARMAENWLMEPLREAIRTQAVSGMSFRFEVIKEEWRDNKGTLLKDQEEIWRLMWNPDDRGPIKRTLKELKVHELGPVVFPAYAGTSVDLRSYEMANSVMGDRELVHECRSALAMDKFGPYHLTEEIEDDRELRRNVARAILFRDLKPAKNVIDVQPNVTGDPAEISRIIEAQLDRYFKRSRSQPATILEVKETEPSNKDTQEASEPLRDGHSAKKEVDPHLRARIESARKRMNLRLGYISEDL